MNSIWKHDLCIKFGGSGGQKSALWEIKKRVNLQLRIQFKKKKEKEMDIQTLFNHVFVDNISLLHNFYGIKLFIFISPMSKENLSNRCLK